MCYNKTALKTLEQCTELNYLRMGYQSTGGFNDTSFNLDLSKCENLKGVYIAHATFGILKLPKSVTTVGSYVYGNTKIDVSECTNIKSISFSNYTDLEPNLLTLSYLMNTASNSTSLDTFSCEGQNSILAFLQNIDKLVNCTNLKKISLSQFSWQTGNVNVDTLTNFSKLSNLQNLNEIYLNKMIVQDLDFTPISSLTNLTSLTITNTNLSDVSFMKTLTKLTKATLSNNNIEAGICELANLTNLESLNLSNNALFDMSSKDGVNYRNLEILGNLNYANSGNLNQLYLAGNTNITDWSYVSKYTWPNGKSGF